MIHQYDHTECLHCPPVVLGLLLWSQAESDGEVLQTNWILGLHGFPFRKIISLSKKPQPRNGAKICFTGDK